MTDIDPVSSPDAYRQSLLSALGSDDPVAVQIETVALARELVRASGTWLRVPPEPGEWSVLECLGHIVDSEIVVSARARWILAEERPELVGYDQALWVDRLDHRTDDPAALLTLFEALRASNLDLWSRTTAADHERVGWHRERGEESYDLIFRLLAGHDRIHLGQARRALAAAQAGTT